MTIHFDCFAWQQSAQHYNNISVTCRLVQMHFRSMYCS